MSINVGRETNILIYDGIKELVRKARPDFRESDVIDVALVAVSLFPDALVKAVQDSIGPNASEEEIRSATLAAGEAFPRAFIDELGDYNPSKMRRIPRLAKRLTQKRREYAMRLLGRTLEEL